ncbi:hypothetical protein [Yersinia entomophaga]|nr:hypothetical protein [Yersinia entomophaga]
MNLIKNSTLEALNLAARNGVPQHKKSSFIEDLAVFCDAIHIIG